jgi:transposase
VFVGIDYHTRGLQICVLDGSGRVLRNRRCANSLMAVAEQVEPRWEVRSAAIESCCGAADLAEAIAGDLRWSISLAHPGYVNRMKHNPDKTDYADARMLAELARVGMIPPVWLAPEPIRELRLLVRLRADLVGRVRAVKTRVLSVLRLQRVAEPDKKDGGGRWRGKWLKWLQSEGAGVSEQGRYVLRIHMEELGELAARIKEVEARLRALTAGDAVVKRLLAIKGVGEVTAWTMRAIIGRFDRFATGKQLARFCGVTPRNASSGERVADAGLIKSGDRLLKSVLVEAAHRLRRYEPRWESLGRKLKERGKASSLVIAAIANRWVRSLHHQMKEEMTAAA